MVKTVAVLGPKGTFSDIVAQKHLLKAPNAPKKRYFSTIGGVFSEVEKGTLEGGIVPLHNSLTGPVEETKKALQKYSVKITQKFTLSIHHALVVAKKTDPNHVATIISHPQPLAQCKKYLQKTFPRAEHRESNSTMEAFEMLAGKTNAAAIIPEETAKMHNYTIIAKDIGDSPKNITTFILIEKEETSSEKKP